MFASSLALGRVLVRRRGFDRSTRLNGESRSDFSPSSDRLPAGLEPTQRLSEELRGAAPGPTMSSRTTTAKSNLLAEPHLQRAADAIEVAGALGPRLHNALKVRGSNQRCSLGGSQSSRFALTSQRRTSFRILD